MATVKRTICFLNFFIYSKLTFKIKSKGVIRTCEPTDAVRNSINFNSFPVSQFMEEVAGFFLCAYAI